MNPVVAVIAPGMMGAAVGGRLVENGLKVLTSLKGRSAETAGARQGHRHGRRQRRGDRRDRFHPVDPAAGRRGRAGAALRAGAHRQQQQAGVRRLQRGEPADRRARRRRRRADRLALRRCRHHRLAAQDRAMPVRASTPPARTRRASPRSSNTASTCACSTGPPDRGLGDEDVLCRHHQGHAGARRRDDARGDPRRHGRCAVRRAVSRASRRCWPGSSAASRSCRRRPIAGSRRCTRSPISSARTRPATSSIVGAAHFYEQIARDFEGDKKEVAALEAFLNKGAGT